MKIHVQDKISFLIELDFFFTKNKADFLGKPKKWNIFFGEETDMNLRPFYFIFYLLRKKDNGQNINNEHL